jgi:hypothetical protein
MRNRLKRITCLAILVGASSSMGCVTTNQWAISKGFQRVNLKGEEYFCRLEPANAPLSSSNVHCLPWAQLVNYRMGTDGAAPIVAFSRRDGCF